MINVLVPESDNQNSNLSSVMTKLIEFFTLGSCKYKGSNLSNIELLKDTHNIHDEIYKIQG